MCLICVSAQLSMDTYIAHALNSVPLRSLSSSPLTLLLCPPPRRPHAAGQPGGGQAAAGGPCGVPEEDQQQHCPKPRGLIDRRVAPRIVLRVQYTEARDSSIRREKIYRKGGRESHPDPVRAAYPLQSIYMRAIFPMGFGGCFHRAALAEWVNCRGWGMGVRERVDRGTEKRGAHLAMRNRDTSIWGHVLCVWF